MKKIIKDNSAFVFDLDGTLIYSDIKIGIPVMKNGKLVTTLCAKKFSDHILGPGEHYDFSFASCPTRFANFSLATPIFHDIFLELDKIISKNDTTCELYILTARNPTLYDAIYDFLYNNGTETLKQENVMCLEPDNFPPEAKKEKLTQIRMKHKGDVIFFDDDAKNVEYANTIPDVIGHRVKCQVLEH